MYIFTMESTILIKRIISIITYWMLFNILIILCDLDINTNNAKTNYNTFGLNHTNGKFNQFL